MKIVQMLHKMLRKPARRNGVRKRLHQLADVCLFTADTALESRVLLSAVAAVESVDAASDSIPAEFSESLRSALDQGQSVTVQIEAVGLTVSTDLAAQFDGSILLDVTADFAIENSAERGPIAEIVVSGTASFDGMNGPADTFALGTLDSLVAVASDSNSTVEIVDQSAGQITLAVVPLELDIHTLKPALSESIAKPSVELASGKSHK